MIKFEDKLNWHVSEPFKEVKIESLRILQLVVNAQSNIYPSLFISDLKEKYLNEFEIS